MRKNLVLMGLASALVLSAVPGGYASAEETEEESSAAAEQDSGNSFAEDTDQVIQNFFHLGDPFYTVEELPVIHVDTPEKSVSIQERFREVRDDQGKTHEIGLEGYQEEGGTAYAGYHILVDGEEQIDCQTGESYGADLHYLEANGRGYFYFADKSGIDYANQAAFYTFQDGELTECLSVTGELRGSEEKLFSDWARGKLLCVGGNAILMVWADQSPCIGSFAVPVYLTAAEDGTISLSDQEFPMLDMKSMYREHWTANRSFSTESSPGSGEEAFTVNQGDTVDISEMVWADGSQYYKIVNRNEEEGWLKNDPEEDSKDGYFFEAFFSDSILAG